MKLNHLVKFAVLLLVVNLALDVIGWTHVAAWVTILLAIVVLAIVVWLVVRWWRERRRTGHIDTMRPRKPANPS